MNVVIITCFQPYEARVDSIAEFFIKKNDIVTVIASDFMHISKKYRYDKKDNYIHIKTIPYFSNFSIKRIISHVMFSIKACNFAGKLKPDLIYAVLPPNSLAYMLTRSRNVSERTKIVFDIMDLWPETIPLKIKKDIFPLKIWRNLRDGSLELSDYVITECNLFQDIIKNRGYHLRSKTVYLTKKEPDIIINPKLPNDELHFCYLGSINNIIDIDLIGDILSEVKKNKKVVIHIIGEGENLYKFIGDLNQKKIEVVYHGIIYSNEQKQAIFDKCHFGLNIMKKSVCVGLTMKSIDYFSAGLPIINNIGYDTEKFVSVYNNGYNIDSLNYKSIIELIVNMNELDNLSMREASLKLYKDYFSPAAFEINMNDWYMEFKEE